VAGNVVGGDEPENNPPPPQPAAKPASVPPKKKQVIAQSSNVNDKERKEEVPESPNSSDDHSVSMRIAESERSPSSISSPNSSMIQMNQLTPIKQEPSIKEESSDRGSQSDYLTVGYYNVEERSQVYLFLKPPQPFSVSYTYNPDSTEFTFLDVEFVELSNWLFENHFFTPNELLTMMHAEMHFKKNLFSEEPIYDDLTKEDAEGIKKRFKR